MKIEQLIVQHLYTSKQVTLQGIGTFKLNPSVILPAAHEKDRDFVMPENAFQFEYNLKAVEDEALIKFIVQHTRKILPLASADLDSYVILAKQFLNIGKPLIIEGVGTVQKNQAGIYQFTPGYFVTPKIDDIPRQAKEKPEETVSFETPPAESNSRKNIIILVALLLLAGAGYGIYYWSTTTNTEGSTAITSPATDTDTSAVLPATTSDSVSKKPVDSISVASVPVVKSDSNNFRIVLKTYPSQLAAQKAYSKLTTYGHKLEIITVDSSNYQLAMGFTTPVSDTARAKDSLKRFFGGKPFVKL